MLKGKRALITGGTKGIGFGIAEAMLQEGMFVAITGRNEESINAAVSSLTTGINGKEGKVLGIVSDVKSIASQQLTVEKIVAEWGGLDVLIANAGIGHFGSIEHLTAEQWHDTMDTNLTGVFNSVKSVLSSLKESKGYIFTISSLAGTNFFAGGTAYNASKFGLTGFTQALMLDLRQYDVKVSTIMPGSVATYFNGHIPSDADAWKIQKEDIAQIVVDLLKMHPRVLPSKVEVRPTKPPVKG